MYLIVETYSECVYDHYDTKEYASYRVERQRVHECSTIDEFNAKWLSLDKDKPIKLVAYKAEKLDVLKKVHVEVVCA